MIRVVALEIMLFLLPFAAYGIWLAAQRRVVIDGENWKSAPIAWLAVGGLVLVALGLGALVLAHQGPTAGRYVPAKVENGQLIPGHFEK
jgi:hypothetical protein